MNYVKAAITEQDAASIRSDIKASNHLHELARTYVETMTKHEWVIDHVTNSYL
ncbi:hypothetical protein ACO0LG_16325 [Undibacterium sp. Ji42W]|uniref:hypothetical protein n=1 Tax=Undibacterium sp. Ji42W TaxID=3413039 RepID=UPI003BF2380A